MDLPKKIEAAIGEGVISLESLSGGCVGEVYKVMLADGGQIAAKVDTSPRPNLMIRLVWN